MSAQSSRSKALQHGCTQRPPGPAPPVTLRRARAQALGERRHLLRLWVTPRPARLPPAARAAFQHSVLASQDTGISVDDNVLTVPLEAE